MNKPTDTIRERISEILVKWEISTRQVAINELTELYFHLIDPQEMLKILEGIKRDIPRITGTQYENEIGYNQALSDIATIIKSRYKLDK
jgi:hypothetical protein